MRGAAGEHIYKYEFKCDRWSRPAAALSGKIGELSIFQAVWSVCGPLNADFAAKMRHWDKWTKPDGACIRDSSRDPAPANAEGCEPLDVPGLTSEGVRARS